MVLNLWRNPDTAFEALAIYHTLKNKPSPPGPQGQGALEFSLDRSRDEEVGRGNGLSLARNAKLAGVDVTLRLCAVRPDSGGLFHYQGGIVAAGSEGFRPRYL